MRIGIDFDNTLVNYTEIFGMIAEEMGLGSGDNAKMAVKTHLVSRQGDDTLWKEIQARVYGVLINKAVCLPDFIDFFRYAEKNGIELFIVSYKTAFAQLNGDPVSLHNAARKWLDQNLPFFKKENVFFETAVAKKIRRIASLDLDYYVDDLLSILYHRDFPKNVKKILFGNGSGVSARRKKTLPVTNNWTGVIRIVQNKKTLVS